MEVVFGQYPNWNKIIEFIQNHIEFGKTKLNQLTSNDYENMYQYLFELIEKGIEEGEFSPEQSTELIINSTIITLVGTGTLHQNIKSRRFIVAKQLQFIQDQLREDLVVI
ncbi:hypothetical protein ACFYKX_15745 [Cytobacillus sp. FJAT-54145]|uniref:YfiR C-terminal domain-containing protein n=1 Tax=Cytobacillus spartinae TaxID=3299023 RepID=A0ABW6KFR5_9BACI